MRMDLTAAFQRVPDGGYVARVDEIPEVLTQGETLDDARANLQDAVQLVIDARRAEAAKLLTGADFIRERITVEVPDAEVGA